MTLSFTEQNLNNELQKKDENESQIKYNMIELASILNNDSSNNIDNFSKKLNTKANAKAACQLIHFSKYKNSNFNSKLDNLFLFNNNNNDEVFDFNRIILKHEINLNNCIDIFPKEKIKYTKETQTIEDEIESNNFLMLENTNEDLLLDKST